MKNELIKKHIIAPALVAIGAYSDDRMDMVFVTGAVESDYTLIKQIGGSAASWFQIERDTHDDLYRFIGNPKRQAILDGLIRLTDGQLTFKELGVNPFYAAACCAIRYMYEPSPLPKAGKRMAQAVYWKQFYNTPQGRGTEEAFLERVTAVTIRDF